MRTSDHNAPGAGETAKSGRHAVESAQRFWVRIIAGGSAKSLRGVGTVLALATAGAIASALVGGIWYLAIGDLLDDRSTAATTAIAGSIFIWLFATGAAARAIFRRQGEPTRRPRLRRHSR